MKVQVISEYGYKEAAFGLGLSFGKTSGMDFLAYNDTSAQDSVMYKLAGKGLGHDKFLRMISVFLDINAPLYWWKEADTYAIGVVKQSESTMHTITKRLLTDKDFDGVDLDYLGKINALISSYNLTRNPDTWKKIVSALPSSFLQRRIVMCNYAVFQNIIKQRRGHKLSEWRIFIDSVLKGIEHPELLVGEKDGMD